MIFAFRGPGDLLGELSAIDGRGRSATVTALTDVQAVVLTRAELRQLMRTTPDVTFELLVMVVNRLRESTRLRFESGVYDVTTRTARWLLDAAAHSEPIAKTSGYLVRLTQSELADAVGASRVAVANALRTFREDDAVRTDRAAFRVLRPERLRAFAFRSGAGP